MALLSNIRKIIAEDFKEEDRETISKLGDILNSFMEEVYNSYQKNINFNNLNQELVKVKVKVTSAGIPTITTKFSSNLKRIEGISVINAKNRTSTSVYPTGGILITYEQNSAGLYTIKHVTGIPVSNEFDLVLLLIGSDN